MAHVQWCVGNTTLREARRVKDGLKVLKDHFNGQAWSYENQTKFLELLASTPASGTTDPIYDMGPDKSPKQIEQHGRIWSSSFNELGFATCYKRGNKYVKAGVHITSAGEALLSNDYVEEDVWLRQLLKVQLPNPFPQKTKSHYPQFFLLPFQAVLKIIFECDGISKDEGFIINTLHSFHDIDSAIQHIKTHRDAVARIRPQGRNAIRRYIATAKIEWARKLYDQDIRERLRLISEFYGCAAPSEEKILVAIIKSGKGSKTKKALNLKAVLLDLKRKNDPLEDMNKAFLFYFCKMKSDSWGDYIDATSRYFRMSRVLTIKRNRIVIAESHQEIVKWILRKNWTCASDEKYASYLHDSSLPALPQDEITFIDDSLKKQLSFLKDRLSLEQKNLIQTRLDQSNQNPLLMRKLLSDSISIFREIKEFEYMEQLHANSESIDEVVNYFDSILEDEVLGDKPTHFEWNIWRGFLTIDRLAQEPAKCRNFSIDDDLQPISHAPGNRADMVFYYNDYVLVVEVTLLPGERQYSAEAEPVPRHVRRVIEQEGTTPVYALFIAPSIHVNTAMHFYGAMTTVPSITRSGEKVFPRIIPITLEQYISLLSTFKEKRFTPLDMKNLLDKIVALQYEAGVSDGRQWVSRIDGVIKEWETLLA